MNGTIISESQFYMWRAVFGLAHADGVVSGEEIRYMAEALEDIPFSDVQKSILISDISTQQDVIAMFENISSPADRAKFFEFAHEMVWADGDFSPPEQKIMLKLEEIHVRNTNVDALVGSIDLELDDGAPRAKKTRKPGEIVYSFRERFLKDTPGKKK